MIHSTDQVMHDFALRSSKLLNTMSFNIFFSMLAELRVCADLFVDACAYMQIGLFANSGSHFATTDT